MNQDQLKSTLFVALREAGAMMKEALCAPKNVQKKTELSLVTETDCKCEQRIVDIIKSDFPDHAFLTEESPAQGSSDSRWIIDPIDGTTNFAHSYPVACVSIAFEQDSTVLLGGVYDPFRDELFFAEKGKGAFLNDIPIRVSQAADVAGALLATGFAYDRRERADHYLSLFKAFMMKCQGMRRSGSAALDLCYVACSRFDGFYEEGLNPWDKAAGALLVEEAGGKVSNYRGEVLKFEDNSNLATNGLLHEEMLEVLAGTIDVAKA